MKPKILLSVGLKPNHYAAAILGAGGEPVSMYMPPVDTAYDGLLLCGGNDIHPGHYGRDLMGSVDIDPDRDVRELALTKAFIEAGKPVMGICRGFQLLNVYFGGTLCQHLPDTDIHRVDTVNYGTHRVWAQEGSSLDRLYGRAFPVNSCHHQGVEHLGRGLLATAFHGDLIEAFAHNRLPVFGVQWHPEKMCLNERREDTVDGLPLMAYFVDLCREGM